jgi:hypothetical protein
MANGTIGTPAVVSGTEYLYGVGCATNGSCLLTGAGQPGLRYGTGVMAQDHGRLISGAHTVRGTNGIGQTMCGTDLSDCMSVGAGER